MGETEEKTPKAYDQDLVWEACDALDAEGIKPTYESVRQKLGGKGSYSYISGGMKTWQPKRSQPVPALPEEIAERVHTFAAAVWQSATAASRAAFAIEREAMQQRIADLERGVADYEIDQKRQAAEIEALSAANVAAEQRISEVEGLLHERAGRIAALDTVVERMRGTAGKPGRRKAIKPSLGTEPTGADEGEFSQS